MTSNVKSHRRSLKETFRTILPRRRDDRNIVPPVLSTALTRRHSSLAILPSLSSLSSLPDFDSSSFDIDRYSVSTYSQDEYIPARVWAADYSQQTIVPYNRSTTSLSQYDISDAYQYQSQMGQLAATCSVDLDLHSRGYFRPSNLSLVEEESSQLSTCSRTSSTQPVAANTIHLQSPLSQLAHACNVPSVYRHGTSLQASLATLRSSGRSTSTLRLQRSAQHLPPVQSPPPIPKARRVISIGSSVPATAAPINQGQSFGNTTAAISTPVEHISAVKPPVAQQNQYDAELDAGLSSIEHFSSFCVLDAASPGCPVTATSEDLRLVFEIGEDFCLNTVGIDGASMDTVTGQDAEGNAVIHLVIYNRLINPSSGRSRFVLASLLDITSFITGTASLPDLETISEESFVEEEITTPPRHGPYRSARYEVSTECLVTDCLVPEDQLLQTPLRHKKSDIWLDIATEETRRTRSMRSNPSTPRSCSSGTASSTRSMDDILDKFLAQLQVLYSEFFLLGKSPLDENTYEICNVSSKVHDSREYIEGHLSRTSLADRQHLERQLTQEKAFQMTVRWGIAGDLKRLYGVPLFGRSNVTWVCFLVEEGVWGDTMPMWK